MSVEVWEIDWTCLLVSLARVVVYDCGVEVSICLRYDVSKISYAYEVVRACAIFVGSSDGDNSHDY